jgi:prepilin-type processing-associated H-X9-DG protein
LLPYIEQDNIYKQLVFNPNATTASQLYFQNATNQAVLRNHIKSLRCPSSNEGSSAQRVNIGLYYGTRGVDFTPANNNSTWVNHLGFGPPTSNQFGKTNYLGVAGDYRFGDGYRGVFYWNQRLAFTHISDGTSNTMMFGETHVGKFGATTTNDYYAFSWGTTSLFIGFGLSTGTTDNSGGGKFGSMHANLVQFCFADGSVRPLHNPAFYNVNPGFSILAAMAGKSDGKVVTFD